MKLDIPQQSEPTQESTPNDPHKLKQVLDTLPKTNMGVLTKQVFHILRDQNQQVMPYPNRLKNLEMLRVHARDIFINLKKYFINRTLPLPVKSQKIVNLNQSILLELVQGYEIIADEASQPKSKVDDETLTIAVCRAINYLSEALLRCSEVYSHCPKNLWRDTHQLYTLAESRNLADKTVINSERGIDETTIGDSYKQILLFALARPISLSQSDCDRTYKELFKWSQYANVHSVVTEDMVNNVFCMKTNQDIAPRYLCQNDAPEDPSIRILDTRELVAHIGTILEKQSKEKPKLAVGDSMSLETLSTLMTSWGESPKRTYNRTERQEQISVVIGLSSICKAMLKDYDTDTPVHSRPNYGFVQTIQSSANDTPIDERHDFFKSQDPAIEDVNFTLQAIEGDDQKNTATSPFEDNKDNQWDMVAKGRVLTPSYERDRQLIDETKIESIQSNSDSYWEVVNFSPGGYCLRWNSDNTSKAQIGELIALQEPNLQTERKWHIGVIRWMQFTREAGLEIGVQVLSPQVIPATAQRANRLDEEPFDCLMLPGIEALSQTSTALLPSHAFKTNAKLIIRAFEHTLKINLGEMKERTGSFTQFSYSDTNAAKKTDKTANSDDSQHNKDNFDELWSSL